MIIAAHILAYALAALPIFVVGPVFPEGTIIGSLVLASTLIALSVMDFRQFKLPDILTLPLAIAGIAMASLFAWDDPLVRIFGAAAGFLTMFAVSWIYARIRSRHGLRLGAAKLFAASGAWLGAGGLPAVLVYACVTALPFAVLLILRRRTTSLNTAIPFGPFLAAGTWLVWLYGPSWFYGPM